MCNYWIWSKKYLLSRYVPISLRAAKNWFVALGHLGKKQSPKQFLSIFLHYFQSEFSSQANHKMEGTFGHNVLVFHYRSKERGLSDSSVTMTDDRWKSIRFVFLRCGKLYFLLKTSAILMRLWCMFRKTPQSIILLRQIQCWHVCRALNYKVSTFYAE